MSVFVIVLLMPVLAQADQSGDNVYEVQPKAGGDSYFAYIVDTTADPLQLRIYYKPGKNPGDRDSERRANVDIIPVGRASADSAIKRRLDADSVVINKERYPKVEVERANQARTWALELDESLKLPDPTPVDPGAAPDTAAPEISPLALRGPQIGLVLCSLIVIGIIVKLLIIG
ncbi:MAG: hypothetical protein HUU46_18110 [Candidatus Hydrogenedentes bacterium]|nr:hypothetical protein [Candidatus Hydrogenedentota bacterium]